MIKSCIVGYGVISQRHVTSIAESKYSELYAVCDIDEEKLKKAKADNEDIKVFLDFDEMLKDKEIDVVHICTPHYLHCEMTEKALLSGRNVVLEKPVCISMEEFERIERAQEKSSKKVCICFQGRERASVKKMKEVLLEIGEIKAINGVLMWQKDEAYYNSGDWRGKWATEGGGLVINQAIHTVDLMGYLTGGYTAINGSISTKKLGNVIEVEDTADAFFDTKCGAQGLLMASNCYPLNSDVRLEVNCEKGTLLYTNRELHLIQDGKDTIIGTDLLQVNGKAYWGNGHEEVIDNFYKFIETGKGEYISLESTKNTMQAVFALYESSKKLEKVVIK